MAVVLAIDPGSQFSGWVVYNGATAGIRAHDRTENEQLLDQLRRLGDELEVVVIEWTAPRGMPASAELFETLWWAGRFAEAARDKRVERVNRLEVKRHLCGSTASKDTNVHAALIDRFGGVGGKAAAVGVKASPGPLYGVKRDVWAALGVAVTWTDQYEEAAA